jgi:hypothetical protein
MAADTHRGARRSGILPASDEAVLGCRFGARSFDSLTKGNTAR